MRLTFPRHVVLAALLLLSSHPAIAAAPPAELLRAADLQADVTLLEQAYTQLHPGLHRYNTPKRMAQHFRDLRRDLDHDQPLAEAYLAFSRFAAKVRCGHTYANFHNQPERIAAALFRSDNRVPFRFRWLGRRMVITKNLSSDPSLVPGTEILAIEGVPVGRILDRLMTVARADGHNDAKRRADLEITGADRLAAFDIYLPLFFPQVDTRHTLRVRSPGNRTARTVDVPALTHAQRLADLDLPAGADAPVFAVRDVGNDAVLLDMPTWALYDSRWDWRGFLRNTFRDLLARGTQTLVIDLRRNEGGLGVGDVILAHLVDRPLAMPGYRRLLRYRETPQSLRPYLDTWDRSFHDWGAAARDIDDPAFLQLVREGEAADGDIVVPEAPRFTGRVYALVGATNSSATFEFARALRDSGLGTLVGQTTGGNRRGINGGAFFFLRLPRSGIELDLPLVGQFPSTPQPDAGIDPDLRTSPTPADIAAGRDVELEAALADARRRRTPT